MNLLIENLVKELIIGTKKSLDNKEILLDKKREKMLLNILYTELTKPSFQQSKTPTQIINEFLSKEFKDYFDFTPHDFGEQAHELIMEWGIKKAKDMNEQESN